jgi:hypothetical protein
MDSSLTKTPYIFSFIYIDIAFINFSTTYILLFLLYNKDVVNRNVVNKDVI